MSLRKKGIMIDENTIYYETEPMDQSKFLLPNGREWEEWDEKCTLIEIRCNSFNKKQEYNEYRIEEAEKLLSSLCDLGYDGLEVWQWIKTIPKPEQLKDAEDFFPPEPESI